MTLEELLPKGHPETGKIATIIDDNASPVENTTAKPGPQSSNNRGGKEFPKSGRHMAKTPRT